MRLINDVIPNIIIITFPLLIYFIYNCYRELKCEKYNNLLLNVALFSSLCLFLKYGNTKTYSQVLLFSNIPILLAYLKKQPQVAILLSIIIVFYASKMPNQSLIIMSLKFISYLLIYIIGRKRNIKENTFIILIAILQGFFVSIEYSFISTTFNIINIVELLIAIILFYILPIIILYLFNLADSITSLFLAVSEIEKDKQLKNSLFKITHEVKNPIAVCKGYLDMINLDDKEKVKKYIPIISQEIDRSLNIMNDFMEFSKIKIEKDILDINILLEDIIEELQLIVKSKNIKIISKIPQDEIFIDGDYNRLKQVFINIIKNSIESIDTNGDITVVTHALKDKYYIEITDTGCGMDEYTLSKIKELFFTTKVKGSGLGVSLSNEIIKAHNGTIDYTSKLGKGTKVVVKLPTTMI